MNSSSSDDEDYARSAAFDTTVSASSSAVGRKAPRPRPAPAAAAAAASSLTNAGSNEIVVLDDDSSSSSSSSDSCDFVCGANGNSKRDGGAGGGGASAADASSPAGFASSSNTKPQQAAAAARPSRPPAPPAAAASYSNDRNASGNNRINYGGSFSSDDDSSSDDDPDGLLSSGPIFASSSVSRHSAAAGGGGGAGDGIPATGTNAAAERLRRTLSRLESLSSVASSTPASGAATAGNNKSEGVRKRTAEERAAEAAAKKAKKAREVEGRKRAREAERAAKTRKKEEERTIRARRVLEDRQASGKFAAEEICALVDGDLARAGAGAGFGEAVGGSNASRSRDGGAVAAAAVTEGLGPMLLAALREKKHRVVVEGDTSLSTRIGESNVDDVAPVRWDGPPVGRGVGCVRWIRRDHVDGGSAGVAAAPSNDEAVQRTDMVAIVFHEPGAFLKLLERAASAEARDDYPELRAWLGRVRTSLASRWEQRWKSDPEVGGGKRGKKPAAGGGSNWAENNSGGNGIASSSSRLVLVLHRVQAELQRQWNNGGRRRQSFAPTSEEELNDATVWLLMEENVECTLTSCDDETVDYLVNMTRALSEAPYYEDVTELHCVKKLKADAAATSVVEKAQCAWMRMARQVPGMSETKARKLVEHFPTLMSLVEKYEDPNLTLDEKKRLLDDCLVEGRKSKKLSDSFYRLMTSNDPNELIS